MFSKDTVQIIVITPIPDALGSVHFWTKLAVHDDYLASIINITIGNQNKIITNYWGGQASSCSDPVLIWHNEGRFYLAPGTYSWTATYYAYTVSGTITINRGVCVLQEIVF